MSGNGKRPSTPAPPRPSQRPNSAMARMLRGEAAPSDLAETREVLAELARRKGHRVPVELLVERVLAVTEGTDFPSRRAAMEALLRRASFAARDELSIDETPAAGRLHGTYRLAGRRPAESQAKRRQVRPYATELVQLEPFRGSCDCPDFLRGSLGLCKHLLVVLEHVLGSERRAAAARRELTEPAPPSLPILRWDPVRPWRGEGDRLLGLALESPARVASPTGRAKRSSLADGEALRRWFRDGRPQAAALAAPKRRHELLRTLSLAMAAPVIVAEAAARAVVQDELAVVERQLAARQAAPAIAAQTKSLKRKLYPYQVEGVRRFLEARRLLLADDMGLGKTTQAVAACHALFRAGAVPRGLLIVPASLKSQWLREWAAVSDVPVWAVDGRPEERAKLYRATKRGFLVMNYEQLLRDLGEVHRFAPEVVVLDEAQRIKNYATKSSLSVKTLTPEWRLVLTGTPMENRLEELASILDWVDDVALTPKWRLVPWHSIEVGDGGKGSAGARNLDTLRARIARCTVRRVRQEVLAQLPPRTDTRVPVPMTEQQRAEHDDLALPIASLAQRARQRPLTQAEFLRLMSLLTTQRIISNGLGQLWFDELWPTIAKRDPEPALLESTFAPKLGELRRLIEELVVDQGRKVVVFSQWRAMLRLGEWAVRDVLARAGYQAAFFTGAESQALRTQNVVEFHDDPRTAVLFLSDAGGVGLNLQRAASACINLELPWNPAVLEQRIGRIYRLGQKAPIDVYNLVTDYGIEARIAAVVATKKALFSGLFDGTTDEVRFASKTGFLADVERLVEKIEVVLPSPEAAASAADEGEEDRRDDSPQTARAEGASPQSVGSASAGPGSGGPASAGPSSGGPGSPGAERGASGAPGALLGRLSLVRNSDGSVRIEAPPEAAEELLHLFEGMAALLRQARADS